MLRLFALCLLTLTLALGTVSCHKGSSVKSHRDYSHDDRHGRDHSGESDKAAGDWKTLNVKLTRHDNKALYAELRSWLGTPYRYAASDKGSGTDCSGMVKEVYATVYDKKLERNSAKMYEKNCKEISRDDLREGDLVFFITGSSGRISHVGIYLKEGKFVHASSSRGVMVSDMADRYWREHYAASGRVK